jgi:hypothetical protein
VKHSNCVELAFNGFPLAESRSTSDIFGSRLGVFEVGVSRFSIIYRDFSGQEWTDGK